MAKYRIKAYFMHEHERDAAQLAERDRTIKNADWTDGYVIGVVDQRNIKKLTEKGLVVTPIEKIAEKPAGDGVRRDARRGPPSQSPQSPATPKVASLDKPRPLTVAVPDKSSAEKVLSRDRNDTQFYVVRLHGPLTEDRRKVLERAQLQLLEALSNCSFTIRLNPDQIDRLAGLAFVDTIRLYSEADTLRLMTETQPPREKKASRRGSARDALGGARRPAPSQLYGVKLHRAEDMDKIVQWLKGRNRVPLSPHADVLRVALAANGDDVTELAKLPEVAVVTPIVPPRALDREARRVLHLEQNGGSALGLDGDGEIIGIADTGLDDQHPDFAGRIVDVRAWGRPRDHSDPEGHGTHVAGCALGDGSSSGGLIKGAAPKARLFFQSILDAQGNLGGLPDDLGQLFDEAYAQSVRIHNNSWGAFAYASYSVTSRDVDQFVFDHPDMLIVIAAGNDGIAVPRVPGSHTLSKTGFVDWPCVAAPSTAKNGLTVGASRNTRKAYGYSTLKWGTAWADRYPKPPIASETVSGDDQCLAAFSSRGPCDDNRIKPDLVAPGTDIAAAKSAQAPLYKFWGAFPNNPLYAFMGGTSMAAPYVAGCAALVREWYVKKAGWAAPSAALLKATLINGAIRLSGADAVAKLAGYPNFHQGFGRVDMANSVPNPMQPKLKLGSVDTWKIPTRIFSRTGERFRYAIDVGSDLPLRICLAWTDLPMRALQNRLFLIVDNNSGEKFTGNADAAATLRIAGAISDPNNNVQIVRIEKPTPGTYTIAITAQTLLQPLQSFALVVTGDLQSTLSERPGL